VLIELYIWAFFSIAYGAFITIAIIGFGRLRKSIPFENISNRQFISIIISARNEAHCIEACIKEIEKQHFLKNNFELIIVDDASEDNTYQLALNLLNKLDISHHIIKQEVHLGKKKNISLAIEKAKGAIIITSDADVINRHSNWLRTISDYFEMYSPNMLIMPVDFETKLGILSCFQIVENLALTAITAGYCGINKAFMCNGANLAFLKQAYHSVDGYNNHIHYSSGEDVFLLEELKKMDEKAIHYGLLKELIVKTIALETMTSFFNQRLRWASKAKNNSNTLSLSAGFIILGTNLLVLALLMGILQESLLVSYLLVFIIAKIVFDFLLLFLAADFLRRYQYMWLVIPFQCVYWIYALTVGTASLFLKPYWKEKKIN